MKIRSQHNALGVAVLASLTALPVTPVVLALSASRRSTSLVTEPGRWLTPS